MLVRKLRAVKERLSEVFDTKGPQGFSRSPQFKFGVPPNTGEWAWKYDSLTSLQNLEPILRPFRPEATRPLVMAELIDSAQLISPSDSVEIGLIPIPSLSWAVILSWFHQEIFLLYHGIVQPGLYPFFSEHHSKCCPSNIIWDVLKRFKDKGSIPEYWYDTIFNHHTPDQLDLIRQWYPAMLAKYSYKFSKTSGRKYLKNELQLLR
ncbi:MAG: hypothetical protein ACTSRK_07485 [Promethearchaeota archaeon]